MRPSALKKAASCLGGPGHPPQWCCASPPQLQALQLPFSRTLVLTLTPFSRGQQSQSCWRHPFSRTGPPSSLPAVLFQGCCWHQDRFGVGPEPKLSLFQGLAVLLFLLLGKIFQLLLSTGDRLFQGFQVGEVAGGSAFCSADHCFCCLTCLLCPVVVPGPRALPLLLSQSMPAPFLKGTWTFFKPGAGPFSRDCRAFSSQIEKSGFFKLTIAN